MFSVTINEKGGQQSQYDFSKPEITIGRMKGNDIVLPKGNVSKQHTRIFQRDGDFFIVDLKSTNGTYVNGRKVTSEQRIDESDKIYIGDFVLQLERQQASQSQPGAAGGPPSPPQPQRGSDAGQSGGGRNFPTVMEGARDGGPPPASPGSTGPQPQQPQQPQQSQPPRQPQQPQRSTSTAGRGSVGGAEPEDLRKTRGDAAPVEELSPEIESIDEEIEPLPEPSVPKPSSPEPTASSPEPVPSSPEPTHQSVSGDAQVAGRSNVPTPTPDQGGGASPQAGQSPSPAPAQPAGGQSPAAVSAGVADRAPLESSFDDAFHQACRQVAEVFLQDNPLERLPVDYPLNNPAKTRQLEKAVKRAVDKANPNADTARVTRAITDEATGLGVLETYLDDESVRAIYVNAYDRVVLRTNGSLQVAEQAFSSPELLDLTARRLLGSHEDLPVSEEIRFDDGTRVHVVMPPVAVDGPSLTVQKPNDSFPDLVQLAEQGSMSPGMAEFLERAVEAGRSIAIAGPISSGKSTLLAALADVVPGSSRVIAVEQHSNLPVNKPNFIRLEANPSSGYDMRSLVRDATAMHPQRILLDECRGPEAYEWVTAATGGTAGSMLTLHGTSAVDALGRLESMCLMATDDISPRGLREQIAHCVDLVVVLNATPEGGFRIQQIAEVQGVDIDAFRLNDIFYYRVEGSSGDFHPTGYIPLFFEDLRHAGLDVDLDIFRE